MHPTHFISFADAAALHEAMRTLTLKTLRGLTPHEYICEIWTECPDEFRLNPVDHNAEPYT
jgi:hypothetical protein